MFVKYADERNVNHLEKENHRILVLQIRAADEKQAVITYGKRYTVIIKLETLKETEKQRVMDFIFGAAYVLEIQVIEIAKDIYLLAPGLIGIINIDCLMNND
ncbi:cell division protein SepF [Clostridium sp. AF19-22AC]|jgi:FtsZ-interacting cell division protein YlmF|uniref:cell division protein SepF n=1 Tax=Clostridia TaxID=186801 RepID=UPI000E49C50F|nr:MULTISPECIES: cell division protein SepF [Clostridia]RHR25848.1 cell division protein SepF [Clostridium sp. AF19-22AC]